MCLHVPIPGANWKGLVNVTFEGECLDAMTSNPIPTFVASFSRSQTVVTTNGHYTLTLQISTLNGTTQLTTRGLQRRLGPSNKSLVFQVSAQGYIPKAISVPHNTIIVDETNMLNIVLQKE